MKRLCATVLLFLLAFASSQFARAQPAYCLDPIRITTSDGYSPFSSRDSEGRFSGLDVTFTRNVFDRVGCRYELVALPFRRALLEIADGGVDVMPYASISEERAKVAKFSRAYRNKTVGLVFRSGEVAKTPLSSLDDIAARGLVLGHMKDTHRGEEFNAFLARPDAGRHVFFVQNMTEGLRMLDAGRVDALVEMPTSVFAIAEKMGLSDRIAEHPFTIWRDPVHFMFSRKTVSDELIEAVNAAIAAEIETGAYKALFGSLAVNFEDSEDVTN
jgi:polar amino acid transport system substrate-binding protein